MRCKQRVEANNNSNRWKLALVDQNLVQKSKPKNAKYNYFAAAVWQTYVVHVGQDAKLLAVAHDDFRHEGLLHALLRLGSIRTVQHEQLQLK